MLRIKKFCFQVLFLLVILNVVLAKVVPAENLQKRPRNINYHYEKTGELIKSGSSATPYFSQYEVEENEDQPPEYSAAESANFGSYDFGGPGFSGTGYSDGFGGVNQLSNLGYSGSGIGQGLNGYSSGYSIGNNYLSQPGFYSSGLGGGYVQRPFITGGNGGYAGIHGGQIGGGYLDKNQYESAKKNTGDENLEKVEGKAGNSANEGNQGYKQGVAEQSSSKGDTGFYKDESANKKEIGDGKSYQGVQNYDKSGKEGKFENNAKSHKKGHVTKGFKSTHRKDEEEKTETFYDEAHDEADHKNLNQNQGSYGEKTAAEFKGGHENEEKDVKAQGKEGHYNSQQKVEDSKSNKGEFGQTAFKGNSEEFLKKNGLGAQSILGHQESSGQYLQNKPYGILPIHGDKK